MDTNRCRNSCLNIACYKWLNIIHFITDQCLPGTMYLVRQRTTMLVGSRRQRYLTLPTRYTKYNASLSFGWRPQGNACLCLESFLKMIIVSLGVATRRA